MVSPNEAFRFYRPFLPLFGGIFFCLLGVGATLATVPFYVMRTLDGSDVEIGVAIAAIAVSAVIARPVAGRIADQRGYKPVMLVGTVVCVLAGVAYLLADTMAALLAVRVLHGVGEGAVYTGGAAWLVSLAPTERRGRVVGLYGVSMWTGIALGTVVGGLVMAWAGFAAVWVTCAALAAVGVLLVIAKPHAEHPAPAKGKSSFLPSAALLPGAALSLAGFGYASLAAFVGLHMAARGVENGILALNVFGITYIGVRLVVGHWPDRYGANRVAFWSALTEAVGLLMVALAPNVGVAVAGSLVMGAGLSLLFPSLALMVLNRTAKSQQGAGLGAFTSFWDIGLTGGALIAGFIAEITNYPTIYYVMIACALVAALLVLIEAAQRRAREAAHSPA